ncbi:MAG: hypothetical protein MUO39_13880 [Steroidobacteraceae bacterium]|nr:hypothetical protein [Steroidobacteraceae bacterium]
MMPTLLFLSACAVSGLGFLGHAFGSGKLFVRPLLDAPTLSPQVKWLAYCSWHAVSVLLLGFTIAFGYVATYRESLEIAVFATAMSAAFALVVVSVAIRHDSVMFRLPALYLFSVIALLGLAGVAASLDG